jgi:hypothetical protein
MGYDLSGEAKEAIRAHLDLGLQRAHHPLSHRRG